MRVVVIGGGVMGACTAYYLTEKGGCEVTVVERCDDVATQASGKAGGFLAADWHQEPNATLARLSFRLHEELAEKLGNVQDYRRVTTYSLSADKGAAEDVLFGSRRPRNVIGSEETTAQVHPAKFTRAMMQAAVDRGAELCLGTAVDGVETSDGRVTGVRLAGGDVLACDAVVIAMGPWSALASDWFDALPRVHCDKASSITLHPNASPTASCLFLGDIPGGVKFQHPEIYPRPDGEVYVCAGDGGKHELPADPATVRPGDGDADRLHDIAALVSPTLAATSVSVSQACFLPYSPHGVPMIGPVAGADGLYAATGHSVWGILLGPATGKALAERMLDGRASCIDLDPFKV